MSNIPGRVRVAANESTTLNADFVDSSGTPVVPTTPPTWSVDGSYFAHRISEDGMSCLITPIGQVGYSAVTAHHGRYSVNYVVQIVEAGAAGDAAEKIAQPAASTDSSADSLSGVMTDKVAVLTLQQPQTAEVPQSEEAAAVSQPVSDEMAAAVDTTAAASEEAGSNAPDDAESWVQISDSGIDDDAAAEASGHQRF